MLWLPCAILSGGFYPVSDFLTPGFLDAPLYVKYVVMVYCIETQNTFKNFNSE